MLCRNCLGSSHHRLASKARQTPSPRQLRKIGKTYGLVQDVWFVPQGANLRAGVDRPADWKLPSCK